jgi:hypothetical protein
MKGTRCAIRPETKATSRESRSSLDTSTLHFEELPAERAAGNFPPIKPAEIQMTAACSRISASFCARDSRLATEEAYHVCRVPVARPGAGDRLKRVCPGIFDAADQGKGSNPDLVGCYRLRVVHGMRVARKPRTDVSDCVAMCELVHRLLGWDWLASALTPARCSIQRRRNHDLLKSRLL